MPTPANAPPFPAGRRRTSGGGPRSGSSAAGSPSSCSTVNSLDRSRLSENSTPDRRIQDSAAPACAEVSEIWDPRVSCRPARREKQAHPAGGMLLDSGGAGEAEQGILPLSRLGFGEDPYHNGR